MTSARDTQRTSVVIAEADEGARAWLNDCLAGTCELRAFASGADVVRALRQSNTGHPGSRPSVLIVGQSLTDMTPVELLRSLTTGQSNIAERGVAVFVTATSSALSVVDSDTMPEGVVIRYALDQRLSAQHIQTLVGRAATEAGRGAKSAIDNPDHAAMLTRILDITRSLSGKTRLEDAAVVIEGGIVELTDAQRGYCLFHDADSGILWTESDSERRDVEMGAFAGLSGFAARTATAVSVERADRDPRYDRKLDDPPGQGTESIIACPVAGPDGAIHAVLVAVRSQGPFVDDAHERLAKLAEYASPSVHHLALRAEAESVIEAKVANDSEPLFRQEAIDAYVSRGHQGDVVRVVPPWIRHAYWLLLVLLLSGGVYLGLGRVDEYSVGPAVVRMIGHSDITAHAPGKVVSVEIVPGQKVTAGQILVRLYSAAELAELERVERDWEAQLRARMLDPSDPGARQSVSALRSDVSRARARLEERTIRAPTNGTIADVRVRPSQHVTPGDPVASLTADDTELSVIAFLPGADRPKLAPGMWLRLELLGYRYAYQDLRIDKVSDEIIGPAEARRYLGPRIGDGVRFGGPVVVVEATLPSSVFSAQGKLYRYHNGLQGVAEIRTRSRRIIVALIPQLEEL